MKTIALTQGKVTLVDDDVYEWASKFKWHVSRHGHRFVAVRMSRKAGKRVAILLHREIMQPESGLEVDHRNGDSLNNLRENLRVTTVQQNRMAYKRLLKNKSSIFRGVSRNKRLQKWHSYIKLSGKRLHLGFYEVEEVAARAYDTAAKKLFGEFAQPNFSNA